MTGGHASGEIRIPMPWDESPADEPDDLPVIPYHTPLEIAAADEIEDQPTIVERLGYRLASDLDTAPPPPLLLDRLHPRGHTVLFGTGGVGKGALAAQWCGELAALGERVLLVDYENHPEEWGSRLYGLKANTDLVGHIAPNTPEWKAASGPLWKHTAALRELIAAERISYAIVDSIVFACPGADPSDPNTVGLYGSALLELGVPVLSLAHVPKAGKDLTYPFGSAFWHNQARMTWSLEQDGEHALLTMRKANNYGRVERARITTTWTDGYLIEVAETPYRRVLHDRIRVALGDEALMVKEITTRVNENLEEGEKQASVEVVRITLKRAADGKYPEFAREGDRWRRR
jgi:hypothetical protein